MGIKSCAWVGLAGSLAWVGSAGAQDAAKPAESAPVVDEAPVIEEAPNIHGFLHVPFKTAYITPRGLVVENQGLVVQPVAGLVVPIDDTFTVIGGVWQSWHTNQNDEEVGGFNEIDPFFTVSAKLMDGLDFSVTYVPFISPPNLFETEHNIEFALKYSGLELFDGFTVNPYAKFFWAVSGDSTVVLGDEGDTFDVELGIVPTYTFNLSSDLPVTLTAPTFFTVGPEDFWGGDQNFGVFSTGLTASIPLKFIPARYGHWSMDVGLTYYHLINDNLVEAAELLGGGDERDRFVGTVGIGFKF